LHFIYLFFVSGCDLLKEYEGDIEAAKGLLYAKQKAPAARRGLWFRNATNVVKACQPSVLPHH
jgi:hypothetical protein